MHLPPLPLSSNNYVYTEGEVSIDPSAAIASGVILRAATDSKIIIGAGVCIGIGSILTASQGILEVEAGASLGAGVLVVGKGKIGINCCIGALTTIWNASIEPWQAVAPGSLIGDSGRKMPLSSSDTEHPTSADIPLPTVTHTPGQESLNGQVPVPKTEKTEGSEITDTHSASEQQVEALNSGEVNVYGQDNLNRLLKTLFPYNNQSFNPSPEDS